ncbi:hypothetical protein PUNSTDRAFT_131368 [Punctularia strigosozonata HHB-11173 SS5]|uniref:uncharacterized protein n=1 Tax=Punctularia strigosozonata (strain HHB-11173) TaxID=741275 RepID=UPI0004417225|nr:uncharacterized protein PUNSTDRAFT_131368 [Punctularia strigosozonata HHB-11173 SS5]EIN11190.1 hypothetical protein PUNSTDRAFT_131368 [Punctularia strigosozonata HHB-11173 SS5]
MPTGRIYDLSITGNRERKVVYLVAKVLDDQQTILESATSPDIQWSKYSWLSHRVARWTNGRLPKEFRLLLVATVPVDDSGAQKVPRQPTFLPSNLRLLLKNSLRSDTFIDTKYYCFSRRLGNGTVDKPMALFANSHLCSQSSTYIAALLSDHGFQEGNLRDLHESSPPEEHDCTETYGYDSDSDLEYENPDVNENIMFPTSVSEGQEYSGDESRLKDADEKQALPERYQSKSSQPTGRMGRVVFIKDIAFITWQAYLFYIYTGKITFAPLTSEPRERKLEHPYDEPEPSSPKSMYRLAEKIGDQKLQQIALNAIKGRVTQDNVVEEMFSTFTSRYPEIRKMEVAYFCDSYKSSDVVDAFRGKMQLFSEGQLQYSLDVVMAAFDKLAVGLP